MTRDWKRTGIVGTAVVALAAVFVAIGVVSTGAKAQSQAQSWETRLAEELPLMGHRNLIVVADSAYPYQVAPGIETIVTGRDQLEVVRWVLAALRSVKHVRPNVFLDAELPHVAEADARGVSAYRETLKSVLRDRPAASLPHDEIIGKISHAGAAYRVLVLKTNMTLPYTSVVLELDCGYWNAESEKRLRAALPAVKK